MIAETRKGVVYTSFGFLVRDHRVELSFVGFTEFRDEYVQLSIFSEYAWCVARNEDSEGMGEDKLSLRASEVDVLE